MKCLNCGAPLPKGSTVRRKFCCTACRVQWHKRQRNPSIDAKSKVPPSNGTGDKEVDKILALKAETTLRNTLLKDYLERRDERVRREALEGADQWKEERVLDPSTAKEVADFLARKFAPSGTR